MKHTHVQLHILLLMISFSCTLFAGDNAHFYRANFFWGEPRFDRPWLMTLDSQLAWTQTKSGRTSDGKTTSLLNIYGPFNMQALGSNVAGLDPANPLDAILINLAALPTNDGFGTLQFFGHFSDVEATFDLYQNIYNGFFFEAYLPARRLRISHVSYTDLSPSVGFPNNTTPEWTAFLGAFPQILQQNNISLEPAYRAGVGDFSVLAGWAWNYEDSLHLDFVDISAKIGILFPTGTKADPFRPFDLPLGYNGHYGAPVKFDIAIGAYEWFNLGFHIGALFLAERTQTVLLQTAAAQNGLIKLTPGTVQFDPGTLLDISLYLKADHFLKGLSLLFGYSFNYQERDCLEPEDPTLFNTYIINDDSSFKSWDMHVLHIILEYDFARRITDVGPRIGLFYNKVLGGKRIFNGSVQGFLCGVDTCWYF